MLTTLNKVKSYLNLTDDTQDGFLVDMILAAQTQIEQYCHRKFDLQEYTNEQHISNHAIYPNNYPIKTIKEIRRINNSVYDNYTLDLSPTLDYRIFPTEIQLLDYKQVTITNRLQWAGHEESYIEIDYIAGYSDDDIPYDLSLACTKLVCLEYKCSREDRLGIDNDTVGPLKTQYSKDSVETGIPKYITCILDKYKKVHM